MLRIITLISLCFYYSFSYASTPMYQVDLIVFTHQKASLEDTENGRTLPMIPETRRTILLQNSANDALTPYHTRSIASSQLRNEYWALHHKPEYQVLFHYTWLQPANNQSAIALPAISKDGWNVEGTLRIRRSNYYLLDTDLHFSANNQNQSSFVFAQKQRLKPGTVYYLDHPQAGMIIKVHQLT